MKRKDLLVGAIVAGALLRAAGAWAASCPPPPSDDNQTRRKLAKEWFARAEESESAGNRDAAVRQYACSLRLVPHPSTAFNLAVAAERSGDPSMAADAFRAYLRLMPDAPDRTAVEGRIDRLEKQITELRQQFDEPAPPRAPAKLKMTPPAKTVPAPHIVAEIADPDPDPLPPLLSAAPLSSAPSAGESRLPLWPLFVGATAAVGTGVIFNLVARARMDTCRDPALRASDRVAADQACTSAPPYAYGSYALFALGGVLGGVGGGLLIFGDSAEPRGTLVAVTPTPMVGGGALHVSGAF